MNKFYTLSNIAIIVLLVYTISFIKQDMKLESYKTKRALVFLDTKLSNIQDKMLDNKIDVTVVGYHGRKGPKDDPTIMGSAVQFMAQNSGSPILIVKDGLNR